jgi:hypothetical protein
MKQWAMDMGAEYADIVLTECSSGKGVCETCGAVAVPVWYCGTADECRECFSYSLEYWEGRGGHSSEAIFDSLNACRLPREDSRLYRAVMAGYFAEIRGGN